MDTVWPWVVVAAAGALHGMNPVAGWALAAWCGRPGGGAQALRTLVPVAAGHLASAVLVAAAVPAALLAGLAFEPLVLQGLAAGLLLWLAVRHWRGGVHRGVSASTGQAALALTSFIAATAHGAGWMLVPALASLCAGDQPAREITASGSLVLAVAALGVHLAAMLAMTAAMAAGARWGLRAAGRLLGGRAGGGEAGW